MSSTFCFSEDDIPVDIFNDILQELIEETVSEVPLPISKKQLISGTLKELLFPMGSLKFANRFKWTHTPCGKWASHVILGIVRVVASVLTSAITILKTDGDIRILSILLIIIVYGVAVFGAMGNCISEWDASEEKRVQQNTNDLYRKQADIKHRELLARFDQERMKADQQHNELIARIQEHGLDIENVDDAVARHNARLCKQIANNILDLDVSYRYDTVDMMDPRELQQRELSQDGHM